MGQHSDSLGNYILNNLAFIFPGQGSQKVGMGQDLYNETLIGKMRFEEADEIMDMNLSSLILEGPEEKLKQTEFTQPALYVVSVVLAELLMKDGIIPSLAAGHSLGEYSALAAAGSFSFSEGLQLVKVRSKGMKEAGKTQPGTMAAIIGLDEDAIVKICDDASASGIVQPANFNSHNQIVISGDLNGVRQAMKLAENAGARKTIELNVSGAFHSILMEPAKEKLAEALQLQTLNEPNFPVVMNVTAKQTKDPDEIRQNLLAQLDNPVLWTATVEAIRDAGTSEMVEVGPGRTLQGLIRRIDKSIAIRGVSNLTDIKENVHA